MKIRPLHDWAVIQRIDAGETSSGGIIIPDAAREKPAEGSIIAIGPGVYKPEKGKEKGKKKIFVPTVLKPGQHVAFVDYMARDFTVDGTEVTMIREDDILGTYDSPGGHHLVPKKDNAVSVRHDHPVSVRGAKGSSAVVKHEDRPLSALKPSAPSKQDGKKPAVRKKAAAAPTSVKKSPKKALPAKKKGTKKTATVSGEKTGSGKTKPAAKKAPVKKKTAPSRPKKSASARKPSSKKKTGRKK